MMATKTLFSIALLAALTGCANDYQKFYRPLPGVTPELIAAIRRVPAPTTPQVEHAQPRFDDAFIAAYMKRGYRAIGYSSFTSGRAESESAAIQQAQAIGADLLVIFDPQYRGSTTTNIPVTIPTTSTSYTSGSATAHGPGGTATAFGSATTTTYGSTTSIIPITVNRSSYGAVYFIRPKLEVGAFMRALNDDERTAMQTNKGAVILAVVDGSPAFNADLLAGDVIVAIDDAPVGTLADLNALVAARKGKTIRVKLIRAGKPLEKDVALGA